MTSVANSARRLAVFRLSSATLKKARRRLPLWLFLEQHPSASMEERIEWTVPSAEEGDALVLEDDIRFYLIDLQFYCKTKGMKGVSEI